MEKQLVQCAICGRYHAPWWGRYVPAPSCIVRMEDFKDQMFLRFWTELESEVSDEVSGSSLQSEAGEISGV